MAGVQTKGRNGVYLFEEGKLIGNRSRRQGRRIGIDDQGRVACAPGSRLLLKLVQRLQTGQEVPDGMWEQTLEALKEVEKKTGKTFEILRTLC